MSIKTSKRIALGVIASLVFAPFAAVVPASALVLPNGTATAITLSSVTTTPTVGQPVHLKMGITVAQLAATGTADTLSFQGAITTFPAGGSTSVAAVEAANQTPVGTATPIVPGVSTATTSVVAGGILRVTTTASTTWAAQTVAYLGGFTFTPTKDGVHVITVWNDTDVDGAIDPVEVQQTVSVTVVAATQLAPAQSILRMAGAGDLAVTQNSATATLTNYTATVDAVPRSAAKGTSAATNRIAKVAVVLVNADGSAAKNGHTVTADITGSGLVLCNNSGTAANGTVRSSVLTLTGTDNVAVCHINSDGTAGSGTVTISVTDSVSGVKTLLGTRSFTSYGDVAKLEVSSTNYTIGRAGFATGVASTTRVATTEIGNALNVTATITVTSGTSTTPAFIVKATDSSGNAVTTLDDPVIRSSNLAAVSGGTCALDGGASTVSSSKNGVGFYNCAFNTTQTAKSGDKATLTIRVVDPADEDLFITTTIDVTVGGSVETETITFDKATYSPGEAMVITRTAKDASGNPVFDGATAPAITFNKAIGGTAPGASIYVGGVRATSATSPTVFAPAVFGDFTARMTSGNAAATVITATASVPAPVVPEVVPPAEKPTLAATVSGARLFLSGTAVDGEGDIIIYVKRVGTTAWKERAKTLEVAAPGDFNGSIKAPRGNVVIRVKQEGTGQFSNQVLVLR